MKNYIALLLSCTFVCTQAMEQDDHVNVPILDQNGMPIDYATIIINPSTSLYDLQDLLRQKVGPGNIRPRMGERTQNIPAYSAPLATRHRSALHVQEWIDHINLRFILNQ